APRKAFAPSAPPSTCVSGLYGRAARSGVPAQDPIPTQKRQRRKHKRPLSHVQFHENLYFCHPPKVGGGGNCFWILDFAQGELRQADGWMPARAVSCRP